MTGAYTLLADIGGTNARFALADPAAPMPLLPDSVRAYPVASSGSPEDAARRYLQETGARVDRAVFAIAARISGDQARMLNHPWVVSGSGLRAQLGLAEAVLVNDFTAQAMAVPLLGPDDYAVIGPAPWQPLQGHVHEMQADKVLAVVGPGTGLGVGGLVVRDGRPHPLDSEGGHVSFAPGSALELAILEHLSTRFDRVSNERLVCGPGLVNIHRALAGMAGEDPGSPEPADITAAATAGDPHSAQAVEVFCNVFGAIAGDLVLTLGAWQGVFLTGGMVPRLLEQLRRSGFRERFEHKGRFSATMARVPSVAVLHRHPGLLGAAAIAGQQQGREPR
ncbi:glucokinase [Luteimonas sp. A478]